MFLSYPCGDLKGVLGTYPCGIMRGASGCLLYPNGIFGVLVCVCFIHMDFCGVVVCFRCIHNACRAEPRILRTDSVLLRRGSQQIEVVHSFEFQMFVVWRSRVGQV